jgi:hypothetical protein
MVVSRKEPVALRIDGKRYKLAERDGRRTWTVRPVPSQRGDNSEPTPIEFRDLHLGFGFSHRHRSQGQAVSVDYSENVDHRFDAMLRPAQRITYVDLSAAHGTFGSFMLGGAPGTPLGGGPAINGLATESEPLGGGRLAETPQWIQEGNGFLYIGSGSIVFTVDPADDGVDEVREFSLSASTRDADIHDGNLAVALGGNVAMQGTTSFRTEAQVPTVKTQWETFDTGGDVLADRCVSGRLGRFYTSVGNLIRNTAPGAALKTKGNHLPLAGEALGDSSFPVTKLAEWGAVMVAAKRDNLMNFRLDTGFTSVANLPEVADFPDEYNGRGLKVIGQEIFDPTSRGIFYSAGGPFTRIGPEILPANESPYRNLEWGVPAYTGDATYFPGYNPQTGDSVIFYVRRRLPGEPGLGPFVFVPYLFLEDRKCRVVFFEPGTSSRNPALWFGAGTTANPEQVGHVPTGRGGAPDWVDAGGKPALSSQLLLSGDDYGFPATIKELDRIEIHEVRNATSTNYFVVSASDDDGATWTDFVDGTGGANDERVVADGDTITMFMPSGAAISSVHPKLRIVWTQASGATTFVELAGYMTLYTRMRPTTVDEITTLIEVVADAPRRTLEEVQNDLLAFPAAAVVTLEHSPKKDEKSLMVAITAITEAEEENQDKELRKRKLIHQVVMIERKTA